MKFNLQHFAIVKDPFGDDLELKNAVIPNPPGQLKTVPTTNILKPVETPALRDLTTRPYTTADPGTYAEGQAFKAAEDAKKAAEQATITDDSLIGTETETTRDADAIAMQDAINGNGSDQEISNVLETPKTTNISELIQRRNAEATKNIVAKIREYIAAGKATQQDIIEDAPGEFDPLRAESEVGKAQQLKTALEISANQGDRGGIGRQTALDTQTAGAKRLTQINLAQKKVIGNAKKEIARLESEGKFQEAQAVAAQASQELEQLIIQAQNDEAIAREDRSIARQETIRQEDLATREEDKAFDEQLANITQYSNDYTAEINRRLGTPDTEDDKLIPYLETAKQNKLAGIAEGETQSVVDAKNQAFSKWNAGIPLSQEEMDLIGSSRSTKPVRTTSSGGGTTQSQLFAQADKKVNRGIPLTAAEAQVYGVETGYVDPNFEESTAPEDEPIEDIYPDSTFTSNIAQRLRGTDEDTPLAVINEIVASALMEQVRDGTISNTVQFERLKTRYNISDAEIDAIIEREERRSGSRVLEKIGQEN